MDGIRTRAKRNQTDASDFEVAAVLQRTTDVGPLCHRSSILMRMR